LIIQALKPVALKQEGYEVVLVNSNPATIMTDPEIADRTYVNRSRPEPSLLSSRRRMPCRRLAGDGTGLSIELYEGNTRQIWGKADRGEHRRVKVSVAAFQGRVDESEYRPEGRLLLRGKMQSCRRTGYPAIVAVIHTRRNRRRHAHNQEFEEIAKNSLAASPNSQILVEESILGWKE
jgi:carbamoyl-phosphate synthase large subunit